MPDNNERFDDFTYQTLHDPHPYPGYPSERLLLTQDMIDFPDGPWTINNSPLPTKAEQEQLTNKGYRLDCFGRPLNPNLSKMIDGKRGIITGKGFYYKWGPNYTVDPIVITLDHQNPFILLIQRQDTGLWALPGGFIDGDESPGCAAKREALEETNLVLPDTQPIVIFSGTVLDLRNTAHAWAETTALGWLLDERADV